MKTRYEKAKTPETKFRNVYIKEEFSRESSISYDSGISEIGSSENSSNILSGKKRRYLDCDFDDKITIKIETHKKVKIEICDEPSEKSKLVVNPYAINNKSVVPKHVRCKSKRRNSDPPEIKIDVKRFKKENNCQEDTSKIKRKKTSKKQQNQQEQPEAKCTTFNVSSKTFQIKNCSVKIERCEGIEIPKKNRSPKLTRGDRRINKKEYHIIPSQFLSLQPRIILFQCQSYTWRSIRNDNWTNLDTKIYNSKLFSGTFKEKITFKGQIKCRNIREGNTFLLITYYPKELIDDEWLTIEQYKNMNFMKTLPLNELKTESKKRLFENLTKENKPFVSSKKSSRKYIK